MLIKSISLTSQLVLIMYPLVSPVADLACFTTCRHGKNYSHSLQRNLSLAVLCESYPKQEVHHPRAQKSSFACMHACMHAWSFSHIGILAYWYNSVDFFLTVYKTVSKSKNSEKMMIDKNC